VLGQIGSSIDSNDLDKKENSLTGGKLGCSPVEYK
jgi:hypothetical protein